MLLALRLAARLPTISYNNRHEINIGCCTALLRQYAKKQNYLLIETRREFALPNEANHKREDPSLNNRRNCDTPPLSSPTPKDIKSSVLNKKPQINPPTARSTTWTPEAETTPNNLQTKKQTELSTTSKDAGKAQKQKLSSDVVRQNVKGYVFTRYFDYVKNYDKVLEKNFPSAVKVYRVFFEGVKDFYADMKHYLKISRIAHASPQGVRALNRRELELYMQMPRDMVKVAPALIGSSLPMVGYAIFPLVFMYPRTFLTSHFWSLQQRAEFQQLTLLNRLKCNRSVFRLLQSKLKSASNDECQRDKLHTVFGLIGSGFHPTVDMLLDIKEIFTQPPYNFQSLSGKHVKQLCQMHGVPGSWFKRNRLTEHAFLVHYMDLAILREGGVHNMHPDAMRYSCYIRGLNPSNLRNEEMIEWLRNWVQISTTINEQHLSLFMHLPLFLTYNHPNNWQLIHSNNNK